MERRNPASPPTYRAISTALTWVVLVDAAVLGLVSWLYIRRTLPVYAVLLVVAALFVGTAIVVWRVAPGRGPVAGIRVSKLAWLGVAAYTLAAVGGVINWLVDPSVRSGVQALVGICLGCFAWYIVRAVRKIQRSNAEKGEIRDAR